MNVGCLEHAWTQHTGLTNFVLVALLRNILYYSKAEGTLSRYCELFQASGRVRWMTNPDEIVLCRRRELRIETLVVAIMLRVEKIHMVAGVAVGNISDMSTHFIGKMKLATPVRTSNSIL